MTTELTAARGLTATLIEDEEGATAWEHATRAAVGLALSALYGLALGAREGGAALAVHAAGVPAAIAAVGILGVPALVIALGLVDAPIPPRRLVAAAAGACATTGLSLAGLAPAAALFVVTSEDAATAAAVAAAGLLVAAALGLRRLIVQLGGAAAEASLPRRLSACAVLALFALFAVTLSARTWSDALPILALDAPESTSEAR